MKLYLLTDYRGQFYSSIRAHGASMDLTRLADKFKDLGISLVQQSIAGIDFKTARFKGSYVLYQSSEDPGLHYKDFIEDILLGLHLQGAKLIPGFHLFRAHHNKVFMEILRDLASMPEMKTIRSRYF